MKKVAIIGTGKVGSHLADYLLSSSEISEIHIYNRDQKHLEGRLKSLQLKAHFIDSKIEVLSLDWKSIDDIDLVAICVKECYDPRTKLKSHNYPTWLPKNLRYAGLLADLPLLKNVCEQLNNYTSTVAVISNPIEVTTQLISRWLPNANIFGLGASLDSARLSYFLKKLYGFVIPFNYIPLAGEHGYDLITVKELWKSSDISKRISSEQINNCIDKATEIGFTIVKDLGFTLQDCIPIFANDIEWLLRDKKSNSDFRSFAFCNGEYSLSQPISFSVNVIPFSNYTKTDDERLKSINSRITDIINQLDIQWEAKATGNIV